MTRWMLTAAFERITPGFAEYPTFDAAMTEAIELSKTLVSVTVTITECDPETDEQRYWRQAWKRFIEYKQEKSAGRSPAVPDGPYAKG